MPLLGQPSSWHDPRMTEPLGEFIRLQREIANMSLRQLGELADVSNAYLSQIERGLYQPSAHVLKGIADALQISAEELYARAGLLDEEGRRVSVEEAVRLDERLTPEQKDALLAVYRGFVGSASG
jgi:transcriptional regulator with XRE-family HTH domain